MKPGEVTMDSQMMVRRSWLQNSLVEDKDGQERKRNGPNIQDQVVGSSSVITAMKKAIQREIVPRGRMI